MPSHSTRTSPNRPSRTENSDWGASILLSPWLLGPALTVAFYTLMPRFESQREFFNRYFAAHWTLYAETGLFFLGMAILLRKGLGLINEFRAFEFPFLANMEINGHESHAERAELLAQAFEEVPSHLRPTKLFERIKELGNYILSRGKGQSLEDHLRYLADMAAESTHGSFALVRTITWAIPILGFLGTVIGITMAIAYVTPEQLETALSEVTAGLALAFDTTALALVLSMILVFTTFIVERSEGVVLSRVEQFGIAELAPLFPSEAAEATPLVAAETVAAEQLLKRTEALITWQTNLWQSALENLRGRWLETVERQQSDLSTALQEGMATTLQSHSQQLESTRGEFLSGFRAVAKELSQVVAGVHQSAQDQQAVFQKQIGSLWEQVRTEIAASQEEHKSQLLETTQAFADAIQGWHQDWKQAGDAMTGQLQELQRQGEILLRVTEQEEGLHRLQSTLQSNLQSVRMVEKFEESIHSLNAAVHLLTARTRAAA